jgi:hypothetical protein
MTAGPVPLADEVSRLLGALEDWVRDGGISGVASGATAWAGQHIGGGQECTICPICQLLALLRSAQPETYAHLLTAVTSLTAALRSVAPTGVRAGAKPTVVRIDVS